MSSGSSREKKPRSKRRIVSSKILTRGWTGAVTGFLSGFRNVLGK
jgi:hypothetical protein